MTKQQQIYSVLLERLADDPGCKLAYRRNAGTLEDRLYYRLSYNLYNALEKQLFYLQDERHELKLEDLLVQVK